MSPDYDAMPLSVEQFRIRVVLPRRIGRVLPDLAPLCPGIGLLCMRLFHSPAFALWGCSLGAFCFAFDTLIEQWTVRAAVIDLRRTYRALLRMGHVSDAAELLAKFPYADPRSESTCPVEIE